MKRSQIVRLFAERRESVPLAACRHYRGFRYGGFGHNPYEDYAVGLVNGRELADVRCMFAGAILASRLRTLGDALQLDGIGWPPWDFPWATGGGAPPVVEASSNPDVVCHPCDRGVLASHINREFRWLESSVDSIRQRGYRPHRFGYIRCLQLVRGSERSYLVTDGNHRVAALHALGHSHATVKFVPRLSIRRDHAANWPDVASGKRSLSEALRVFDRYFLEVNRPLPESSVATLIRDEAPLW